MEQQLSNHGTTPLNETAIYQIQLKGKITDALIHSVDDMQLRQDDSTESVSLIGWLPDQSALLGLLNTLNDIRYEIISVRILPNDY